MSDNTKQKKAARERQRATGENYTTALMHVRADQGNGTVDQRIRALLPLIGAYYAERSARAKRFDMERLARPQAPRTAAYLSAHHPAQESLEHALRSLGRSVTQKLLALARAGRDGTDILRVYDGLTVCPLPEEQIVAEIIQIPGLARVIEGALVSAERRGLALSYEWPGQAERAQPSDHGAFRVEVDDEYKALASAVDVWMRGPWLDRSLHDPNLVQRAWARRERVKESRGHRCLTRLAAGRCRGQGCEHLPGSDHSSIWIQDGRPHIFVTQPYHLDPDVLSAMLRACRRLGLRLRLNSAVAWQAPEAILVEVFRNDQP